MIIRKAKISDLDRCVELLHEDDFRSCTGEYPNKEYINEFFSVKIKFLGYRLVTTIIDVMATAR